MLLTSSLSKHLRLVSIKPILIFKILYRNLEINKCIILTEDILTRINNKGIFLFSLNTNSMINLCIIRKLPILPRLNLSTNTIYSHQGIPTTQILLHHTHHIPQATITNLVHNITKLVLHLKILMHIKTE